MAAKGRRGKNETKEIETFYFSVDLGTVREIIMTPITIRPGEKGMMTIKKGKKRREKVRDLLVIDISYTFSKLAAAAAVEYSYIKKNTGWGLVAAQRIYALN